MAVGRRHMGLGGVVQTRFELKPKFKRDEIDFKFLHNLTASNWAFPYRYFLRFEMNFELKFREASMT
jgi:hypothetical protein